MTYVGIVLIYLHCMSREQSMLGSCEGAPSGCMRAGGAGLAGTGGGPGAAGRAQLMSAVTDIVGLSFFATLDMATSILTSLVSQHSAGSTSSDHRTVHVKLSRSSKCDRLSAGHANYNGRGQNRRNCDIVISVICCMWYRSAASRPRCARSSDRRRWTAELDSLRSRIWQKTTTVDFRAVTGEGLAGSQSCSRSAYNHHTCTYKSDLMFERPHDDSHFLSKPCKWNQIGPVII